MAVKVLSHLLDTSNLKWKISHFISNQYFWLTSWRTLKSGSVVYQYTRKKIGQNTQNSSKYTQNYIQVYFIPEIHRKWYTEYPYLSCNIPYTRFKKPLYTVYPKTLADPVKLISLLSMNLQYVNQQVKPIQQ